jgi:PPOX class probable F420-dependent enzyme
MTTYTGHDPPIPEQVREFFDGSLRIGYMATIRPDGHLAVVPVGVMMHDDKLRVSSPLATRKVRNLQANPQVSVCVTDPTDTRRYVTIRGTAEVTLDTDRAFVDWMARTHMGRDEYPYEPRRVQRVIITIRADQFVMPKVHGSSDER